jgi:hypothetical protein
LVRVCDGVVVWYWMKMKEEEEKSALEEKRCGQSGYVPDAAV